jgi:hypothetical protein
MTKGHPQGETIGTSEATVGHEKGRRGAWSRCRGTGGKSAVASANGFASAPANFPPCGEYFATLRNLRFALGYASRCLRLRLRLSVSAFSLFSHRPSHRRRDRGGEVERRGKLVCPSRRGLTARPAPAGLRPHPLSWDFVWFVDNPL